jgi:hypothetical protein
LKIVHTTSSLKRIKRSLIGMPTFRQADGGVAWLDLGMAGADDAVGCNI